MKGQDLNLNLCTESAVIGLKKMDSIHCFTLDGGFSRSGFAAYLNLDRVSVPSPIAIDILMDTMARDRVHMYRFSV